MSGVEWLIFVVIVAAWEWHDHVKRTLQARLSEAEQTARDKDKTHAAARPADRTP